MNNYMKLTFTSLMLYTNSVVLVACSEPNKTEPNEPVSTNQIDKNFSIDVKSKEEILVEDIQVKEDIIVDSVDEVAEDIMKEESEDVAQEKPVAINEEELKAEEEIKEEVVENVIVLKEEVVEEEIAASINHSAWNTLLKKYVSSSGKVNYKGFKADRAALIKYTNYLQSQTPKSEWSKNEKLAYWINVYNAFTVKLIVDNYPLKSIMNIEKAWDKKLIKVGGKTYSLGEVENSILRKMGESRIHFAINCASVSCPKLLNEAYTAEKLPSQLKIVTKQFFMDATKNQISTNSVKISKLFEWYANDFSNGNIISYINKYSGKTVSSSAKISYLEYNWNLNE